MKARRKNARLYIATAPLRVAPAPWARAPQSGYTLAAAFRTTARRETNERFFGFNPRKGMDHHFMGPLIQGMCKDTAVCTDSRPAAYCNNACMTSQTCCGGSGVVSVDTPASAGGSAAFRVQVVSSDTATDLHRTEIWIDGALQQSHDWSPWTDHLHTFSLTKTLGATTLVKVRTPLGRYDDAGHFGRCRAASRTTPLRDLFCWVD